MFENLTLVESIFYITGIIAFIVIMLTLLMIRKIQHKGYTSMIGYLHRIQLNLAKLDSLDEIEYDNGGSSYLQEIRDSLERIERRLTHME